MPVARTSKEIELEILEIWDEIRWSDDHDEIRTLARHALTLEDHLVSVRWAERHGWLA